MSKGIIFRNHQNEKIYPCPFYPIGSVYISFSPTDPSTYFGGTWERIKGRFLLSADDSAYKVNNTGGSVTHHHTTGNCTLEYKHLPSEVCVDGNFGYLSGCAKTGVSGWQITSLRDYGQYGYGQAHNHGNTGDSNNLPPYIVVYMWRRTA